MEIGNVLQTMLVLLTLMAVGFLCRKVGVIDDAANYHLSNLTLNVTQSALVLDAVLSMETPISGRELVELLEISWGLYAVLTGLAFLVPLLLRVPKEDVGTYRLITLFGNVGFMGIPLVSALFGPEAVFYDAMFLIPFNVLCYSLGVYFVSGGNGKFQWKNLLCAPLVASLVSLVFWGFHIQLPAFLCRAIGALADVTVPCAMLIIGASLGKMPLSTVLGSWRMYGFTAIKLLGIPAIVWLIFRMLGVDNEFSQIAIVLSATSVAANSTILCIQYGGNEALASQSVFITTILSVATIPLAVYLFL